MPPGSLRLFAAIELPPHVRDALARAIDALRRDLTGPYRWVAPESLHLTLEFLGDVPATLVEALADALAAAAESVAPFTLSLSGAGTFPERGSPRVVWAGIGGDVDDLVRLQRAVAEALASALAGAAEERLPASSRDRGESENSYHPHLTLARVRDRLAPPAAAALREALGRLSWPPDSAFPVTRIALFQSKLTPNGSIYTRLREAFLRT